MGRGWRAPDYEVDGDGKVVGATCHRHPNNWGRWGPLDQRGTANFITPDHVVAAARLIRTGQIVSCAVPLNSEGPVFPGRPNVFHSYRIAGTDYVAGAPITERLGHFHGTDDVLFMPLQGSTQWDGLAHVGSHHTLYNGFWIGTVDAGGARRCSIEHLAGGLVGRGVLLDLAPGGRLEQAHAITAAELERCIAAEGVVIGTGDILVIRTGHVPWYYQLADKSGYWNGAPGLALDTAEWLHAREVAAVAMDNIAIEVQPFPEEAEHPFPLHGRLIRDLGLTLGEIWWLEDLAATCREKGRWEFFLSAAPLKISGGAGTPLNPVAIF